MSQSAQRKSVFVEVGSFLDQIDDEIAASHVVREVAEILVPERIISHILHHRAAVGKGVRLLQISSVAAESASSAKQESVFPSQVDDLFVSEHGIGCAGLHVQTCAITKRQPEPNGRSARIEDATHLVKTRTTKLSGTMLRRGWGLSAVAAGGGPNFAVTHIHIVVLESSAMVRAPACVGTLSTTLNFSGESS